MKKACFHAPVLLTTTLGQIRGGAKTFHERLCTRAFPPPSPSTISLTLATTGDGRQKYTAEGMLRDFSSRRHEEERGWGRERERERERNEFRLAWAL